jgi:hypothetical protein
MRLLRRWTTVLVMTLMVLPMALMPGRAQAAPDAQANAPGIGRPDLIDRGVFATLCRFSHQAPDDPIVFPNQAGKSHVHTFFGNATTGAASTYDSLRAGATTCRTQEDASGYWVPALYRDGVQVQPVGMKVYYRTGRHAPELVQPFPAGFRMIAGDASATGAQGIRTTFWFCRGLRPQDSPGASGPSATPLSCPAGNPLTLHVLFPECWDGASLDSPDHKSHVAYGRLGTCPASHPVVLPSLAMIAHYPIVGEPGTISLASGGQYSAHADFFNAWDQGFLTRAVVECLNAQMRCGVL